MRYAGTLSLPEPVFEGVLDAAARSLAVHGFRDIVFLGDSGGNQAGQDAVARRLNRAWAGTAVRAHAIEAYYRAATAGGQALLRGRGYDDREIGTHAGLLDTSLMLAVDPELVRRERLEAGRPPGGWEGADGDPGRARAELGRLVEEDIVVQTVDAIRRVLARRAPAPGGTRP
jgi:creatinine amidohydrolase/Fe(II)-dependent formamide hydrolase-like protein